MGQMVISNGMSGRGMARSVERTGRFKSAWPDVYPNRLIVLFCLLPPDFVLSKAVAK